MMKAYFVKYKMHSADNVKEIKVVANNKADAYDKAVFEDIKNFEGSLPYSAWVVKAIYNNGSIKQFKTFEGKAY